MSCNADVTMTFHSSLNQNVRWSRRTLCLWRFELSDLNDHQSSVGSSCLNLDKLNHNFISTTVSSRFTDEQIETNITNLLGNTLADATWSHSDEWTDAAQHFYFDSNWDLEYQEFIKQQNREHEARRNTTSYSRKRKHNDIQTRDINVSEGASVSYNNSSNSDKCLSQSHGQANTTDTTSKIPSSQKGTSTSNSFPSSILEQSTFIERDVSPELATQLPSDEVINPTVPARIPKIDVNTSEK